MSNDLKFTQTVITGNILMHQDIAGHNPAYPV